METTPGPLWNVCLLDAYLMGGSNKLKTTGTKKSRKGRGVEQQMCSKSPPQRLAKSPLH